MAINTGIATRPQSTGFGVVSAVARTVQAAAAHIRGVFDRSGTDQSVTDTHALQTGSGSRMAEYIARNGYQTF